MHTLMYVHVTWNGPTSLRSLVPTYIVGAKNCWRVQRGEEAASKCAPLRLYFLTLLPAHLSGQLDFFNVTANPALLTFSSSFSPSSSSAYLLPTWLSVDPAGQYLHPVPEVGADAAAGVTFFKHAEEQESQSRDVDGYVILSTCREVCEEDALRKMPPLLLQTIIYLLCLSGSIVHSSLYMKRDSLYNIFSRISTC